MSFSGWITVTSTFSGTSGTVNYSAPQNDIASNRSGLIQVGDKTFTITQTASACGFSLNAYGASFNKNGGTSNILTSASASNCTPAFSVVGGVPEVTLDGAFTLSNDIFTQQYTVAPYQAFINWIRSMRIDVSGTKFTIKQTSW